MLYLKEANTEDIELEYDFITNTPENENGFTNAAAGCSREEFETAVLPGLINGARGIGLPEGWVPATELFLWDDDKIVGLFRIRHRLTESLANGAGHIGYAIRKEYRGRGYGSAGLKLAVEKAWELIGEDEIYMSVNKNNGASFRVQQKNGAVVHHEDDEKYYTRIKRQETK